MNRRTADTPAGCSIAEAWSEGTVVLSVSGVLDMTTAPRLEEAIAAALSKRPTAVIVDLTAVDFLASAGMSVLVAARKTADDEIGFAVVGDSPATSRPLHLIGLADLVGLYPTLEDARAGLSR